MDQGLTDHPTVLPQGEARYLRDRSVATCELREPVLDQRDDGGALFRVGIPDHQEMQAIGRHIEPLDADVEAMKGRGEEGLGLAQ